MHTIQPDGRPSRIRQQGMAPSLENQLSKAATSVFLKLNGHAFIIFYE